ncbi:hypothetical protein DFJ67_2748 [Asanoa ferruginea]|uniref:Ribosomally synthesized peptide with SipW-like signal peptide n=1 Tax=Asanoa ferruginea TaxID=53367 RepID=A0A3D9ZHN9_9ACTN|nr:hypothetical protein [Asanoa ferruginea]REF96757.1 hypothetical protein DFJ67_2748 [Asanoa ferruginea]GIF53379.1 hypothetical protein Afe04nite_79180 [Asanoa ferruginea]
MQKRSKRILAATLAAAGVLAAAGTAWAVFSRTGTANATGTAETFNSVTVNGSWLGRGPGQLSLLPGEKGSVNIQVSNPASNTVNARIKKITPSAILGGHITGGTDAGYCASMLSAVTYEPGTTGPVIANDNQLNNVKLQDAVLLQLAADERCSGISFATSWTVEFEATRDGATSGPIVLNP